MSDGKYYTLICAGGVAVPRLMAQVFGLSAEDAIQRGMEDSKRIASGNIYSFALFDGGRTMATWNVNLEPVIRMN